MAERMSLSKILDLSNKAESENSYLNMIKYTYLIYMWNIRSEISDFITFIQRASCQSQGMLPCFPQELLEYQCKNSMEEEMFIFMVVFSVKYLLWSLNLRQTQAFMEEHWMTSYLNPSSHKQCSCSFWPLQRNPWRSSQDQTTKAQLVSTSQGLTRNSLISILKSDAFLGHDHGKVIGVELQWSFMKESQAQTLSTALPTPQSPYSSLIYLIFNLAGSFFKASHPSSVVYTTYSQAFSIQLLFGDMAPPPSVSLHPRLSLSCLLISFSAITCLTALPHWFLCILSYKNQ